MEQAGGGARIRTEKFGFGDRHVELPSLLPRTVGCSATAPHPKQAELLCPLCAAVLAAGIAELVELETTGGGLFVLGGGVVPGSCNPGTAV